MANLNPSTSHENDSINDGFAQRNVPKNRDEDEFEDSLNISISEHISEEIELNSAVDDSIEKPASLHFDKLVSEKKRKLFDFNDSDKSDDVDSDGMRKFTKFDVDNILNDSLSGDNIAKHFMIETETNTQQNSVNEPNHTVSQRTKSDELKIADVNDGAEKTSKTNAATTQCDNTQKSNENSNVVELVHLSDSHKSNSNFRKSEDKNDVILINDHEISIHSLKELQRQRSHLDIELSNANTTSDISDLQIEDNATKGQRSMDDLTGETINDSLAKVELDDIETTDSKSISNEVCRSKSESKSERKSESHSKSEVQSKSESQCEKNDKSGKNDEIKKCQQIKEDSLPDLSVIEEVSATDEKSSRHHHMPNKIEKKNEIQKIIEEVVNKLPLDKENRPPNFYDDLLSVGSKHLTSSQNSTVTDGTVYNVYNAANLNDELNLNLIHLGNKIKELKNINCGMYSVGPFDHSLLISSSRRDSLKEFPHSGRDSSSITTNTTEYRPFQDEFSRVSTKLIHFHKTFRQQ